MACGVAWKHQAVTNRQIDAGLVAAVAVSTIGVLRVRRRRRLGAGENVLAVGVLAVHQAENLALILFELGGLGQAVGVGVGTVAGRHDHFTSRLHRIDNAGQSGLGIDDVGVDRADVRRVLGQHGVLLRQLQNACSTYRIITGGVELDAAGDLFTGLEHIRISTLIIGIGGFVELGS